MAIEIDSDFKEVASAKKLDRYYIPTRYPNGLPGGIPSRYFDDPREAKEAMQLAKNAIDLIEKKLEED
jgi:HEPN domain-containing protein